MAVVQEYFDLTRNYISEFGEKTVLWMQVGTFYEMYANKEVGGGFSGCNIQELAAVGDLMIGNKSASTAMIGFSTYMIDKYIPKFEAAGYTIVVYDQDANVKNTTRSLKCIISPGTYFSLDNSQMNNNAMTMWVEPVKTRGRIGQQETLIIGIANVNVLTGAVNLLEFQEEYISNMHTTYNDIERTLSIYRPSELIIISNMPECSIHDMTKFFNFVPLKQHVHSVSDSAAAGESKLLTKLRNCEKQI